MKSVMRLLGHDSSLNDATAAAECRSAFPAPVLEDLRSNGRTLLSVHRTVEKVWEVVPSSVRRGESSAHSRLEPACSFLRGTLGVGVEGTGLRVDVTGFSNAVLCRYVGHVGARGRNRSVLQTIARGSTVCSQSVYSDSDLSEWGSMGIVSHETRHPKARRRVWLVRSFYEVRACTGEGQQEGKVRLFALCNACVGDGDNVVRAIKSEALYLLEMDEAVRSVLTLHDCEAEVRCNNELCCSVGASGSEVQHSLSLAEGGCYRVYGRTEGYPPRRGEDLCILVCRRGWGFMKGGVVDSIY